MLLINKLVDIQDRRGERGREMERRVCICFAFKEKVGMALKD